MVSYKIRVCLAERFRGMPVKKIVKKVPPHVDGMRLDLVWVELDVGLSRRKIRQIIDVGGAYHNKKRVRIASRVLKTGDEISLQFNMDALKALKKHDVEFVQDDILYYDDDLVVVNKPPLMPSQATRDQSIMHVETCLKKLYEEKKGFNNFYICHRLDKETSGVLVVARHKQANAFVMDQFKQKTTSKHYLALCAGIPEKSNFEVKCYLSSIQKNTGMVNVVNSGGKGSYTKFELLAFNEKHRVSLIACYPETGRSHQLRVHLQSVSLPILGDKKYGHGISKQFPDSITKHLATHHMLHAYELSFRSFDKNNLDIFAPLPKSFQECLIGFNLDIPSNH